MVRPASFRSEVARNSYADAYDTSVAACTVPTEEFDVDTRFGRTHIIRAGRVDAPPIVFLHGKALSSTMWIDQVPLFADTHRVYLVDSIGDINKSVTTTMLKTKADVVEWLDATLDALGLDTTAIVGYSYGAWMATTYAINRPKRVERLAITSPAAVFSGVRLGWLARAMYAHMIRPRRDVAQKFINTTMMPNTVARLPHIPFGQVIEQYLVGVPGFRMAKREAMPTVYKASALEALTMPVLVLVGASESVGNGPKSAVNARARLPHAQVELIPESNHGMNVDQPAVLAAHLTRFLSPNAES